MKFFPILLVAVSVFAVSCERHEFEGPDGTKQLHEKHGAHPAEHSEAAIGHETGHGEHAEKPAEKAHH